MAPKLLRLSLHNSKFAWWALTLLTSQLVAAATLTEDFISRNWFTSGTAVINQALGWIHPPLQIYQYQPSGGAITTTALDVGDGSHGSFNTATYAQFSVNGDLSGNVIRLDLSQYSTLKVTDFNLAAGWTLRPVGSTPLIIKSLSTITVSGIIDCSGDSGAAANANPAIATTGGQGRCGGGTGGAGGASGSAAGTGTVGAAPAATVAGGGAATGAAGGGGGGGGSFSPSTVACAGTNGGGTTPGTAGGCYTTDLNFSKDGGGAGGGGGDTKSSAGSPSSGGSGGGGGGKVILIAASDITIDVDGVSGGIINVSGGTGGPGTAGGGAGGGGGGGTVWITSGGFMTNNGLVNIAGGGGGASAAGAGGTGSNGRVWMIDSLSGFSGSGTTNPITQENVAFTSPGTINFQTGTFTAVSQGYDFASHRTTFNGITSTPINAASGSVTISAEGSKNGFGVDVTGPVSSANISTLSGSRYLRLTVTLNNTSLTSPFELDSLTVDYDAVIINDYSYKSSCGSLNTSGPTPKSFIFLFLLLMSLPLVVWMKLKINYQLIPRESPAPRRDPLIKFGIL